MFELFTFAFVNLLGVISPGPDFAMVTRYGLSGSRKAALLATFGISTALLFHILYCLLGVGFFLQNSPTLFLCVQMGGALYLGYLGVRLLTTNTSNQAQEKPRQRRAFVDGFLTNLLNPKCTLFTLSLFSQFVTPKTPLSVKLTYLALIPITALCWFSLLSFLLTHPTFIPHLQRYQKLFTRTMGVVLLLLSLSILFTSLKTLIN